MHYLTTQILTNLFYLLLNYNLFRVLEFIMEFQLCMQTEFPNFYFISKHIVILVLGMGGQLYIMYSRCMIKVFSDISPSCVFVTNINLGRGLSLCFVNWVGRSPDTTSAGLLICKNSNHYRLVILSNQLLLQQASGCRVSFWPISMEIMKAEI